MESSLTTKEREKKPHIFVVFHQKPDNRIRYKIIDAESEKVLDNPPGKQQSFRTLKEFVKVVKFENVKAVIFNVNDLAGEHGDIDVELQTREKIAAKLQSLKVPYLFVNDQTFMAMDVLISANVVFKIDERILIITLNNEAFTVIELVRNGGYHPGYKFIEKREISCTPENTNFDQLQSDILGKNNPTKVVIKSSNLQSKIMKKLTTKILTFESIVICVNKSSESESMAKVGCAIVRKMYDPDFTTFHILSFCQSSYCISTDPNLKYWDDVSEYVPENTRLPLNRCTRIDRTNVLHYIYCYDKKKKCFKIIKTVKPETYKNAIFDQMFLCFKINENGIPFLNVKAPTEGELMDLNCSLPVIGIFQNVVYLCIKNEKKFVDYWDQLIFMETWSDKFGKQTFLSFEKEKPKLISEIDESCNMKCIIKVQDIIKVMSMPPDKIVIDPTWNFKIHSTPEDPVLIVFENFDGLFSSAPPPFLMALIIKNLLKVIQKSTNIKPEQIGLYLIDETRHRQYFRKEDFTYQFTKEEEDRIESGFEEACKLLDVEYFCTEDICKTRLMTPKTREERHEDWIKCIKESKEYVFKL